MQRTPRLTGRIALAVLTAWALLMIVPDFYRLVRPLASTGFAANNDGLIYDVQGPFPRVEDSPAWRAGLRPGDRLDLTVMACGAPTARQCIDLLAVLGGMGGAQLVLPGRVLALQIIAVGTTEARSVEVAAEEFPTLWLNRAALLANEIVATLFILAAAWLVRTRPGAMTWGFFLYAIWFNSGQNFVYYTFLQSRPRLLLAQEAAGTLMQGISYAGFLLFVLRAPSNRTALAWRGWRVVLPAVALVMIALQMMSYRNEFGRSSEIMSRASFLAGFAVDALAIFILLRNQRGQPPQEYQRLRWILWGCLIGLPAFITASILQSTTLWRVIPGIAAVPPDLIAALYLLHGLLGWFVFEAVRRPRVVNVSVPLRRITVFGFMLSVPALLLHQQVEHLEEWLQLPRWGLFVLATFFVFLISRAHEFGVELADHVFNRAFRREVRALRAVADEILRSASLEELEALLARAPLRTLDLASAAVFRRDGTVYRRHADSPGWARDSATLFDPEDPALPHPKEGACVPIDADDAARLGMPTGLNAPTVAIPIADRLGCHAVALYGPHATGADLSEDERSMLTQLASGAALAYRNLDTEALRRQLAALQAVPRSP